MDFEEIVAIIINGDIYKKKCKYEAQRDDVFNQIKKMGTQYEFDPIIKKRKEKKQHKQ